MLISLPSGLVRSLLVLVAVLCGTIVALVMGILTRAGGDGINYAVIKGGVAFAGAVSLVLLIETSLGLL